MDNLLQDVRYAARSLAKNRSFTIISTLTLALGIGANAAVFSAINAFLLRPLPVQNAGRLMTISTHQSGSAGAGQFSYPDYLDFKQQVQGFSELLAYRVDLVGISDQGKAEQTIVSMVSSNFFPVLGLRPYLGQFFAGDDLEKPGVGPVVVLGYNYWKQRFSADPSIVGRQVKVNGRLLTVIGVTPPEFTGLYSIVEMQAYLPFGQTTISLDNNDFWSKRDFREVRVLGFLKPGTTLQEARASSAMAASRLQKQYPDTDKGLQINVVSEPRSRPEPQEDNGMVVAATFFLGLAALVLLLACANIANLLLVRATARKREMAIRAALGAARTRLIRQLLTESILLGLLGGLAGVLLGGVVANAIRSFRIDAGFPLRFDLTIDWRVFAYSCAAALVTGIVVGLAPALRISRTNVAQVLHDGGRGTSSGSARSRLRNAFVISQIAASFVLLAVAGLFVRSLQNAERLYLGFDPDHVVNFTMDPHLVGFDENKGRQFYRDLEERVHRLPGVEHVSLATMVPLGYYSDDSRVYIQGQPTDDKHAPTQITYNSIDEDYFETMRIPLLRGRPFTGADKQNAPLVAIVNKAMADRMWPRQDAIGKRFSIKSAGGPWIEVVGVAATGKYFGPGEEPRPLFYLPAAQNYASLRALQVRTSVPTESLIPGIERQIRELAPDMPVFDVALMNQALNTGNGFVLYRIAADFTSALGLLGLTLALVGVYGVLSYVTAQRTQEIGIRLALGAERTDILGMVLKQGFRMVVIGIAIGAVLSIAGARLFHSLLVGTRAADPLVTVGMGAFLMAVALLASYVPARRATKVDPMVALRYE